MILSQKEKNYAIVAGVLAVLFVGYELAWLPYRAQLDDVETKSKAAADVLHQNELAMARRHLLEPIWAEIQSGGLKADESEAETQAFGAVYDWSRSAGGDRMLETWNKTRTTQEAGFTVMEWKVTMKGTTAQMGKLLWAMESTAIPVRVADVSFKPVKEGMDDLSLTMTVSTLCMPEAATAEKPATRAGAGTPVSTKGPAGAPVGTTRGAK